MSDGASLYLHHNTSPAVSSSLRPEVWSEPAANTASLTQVKRFMCFSESLSFLFIFTCRWFGFSPSHTQWVWTFGSVLPAQVITSSLLLCSIFSRVCAHEKELLDLHQLSAAFHSSFITHSVIIICLGLSLLAVLVLSLRVRVLSAW